MHLLVYSHSETSVHSHEIFKIGILYNFILTHPQEVLPLKCASPLVNVLQEDVKSGVRVQAVLLLQHPEQQQQLEGHKQLTTACSQVQELLQVMK